MPRIIAGIKTFQRSAFSFQLLLLIVCSLLPQSALGQTLRGSGGGIGSNPSFTVNSPSSVVSSNQQNTGTNVTSITIPAPSSISNGNALVIAVNVTGVTSETWTPPSGFAQIGSTVTQIASSKLVQAAFCKIASSESGNYAVSWNNSGNAQGVIYNLSGTNCSPTAITPTTGNASTLTQAAFSTGTNDLAIIFAGQAESSGAGYSSYPITPGTLLKGPETSFQTELTGYSLPNGGGNTPVITIDWIANPSTSSSNDSIIQVFDFAPSTASAAAIVTGAVANLNAANITKSLNVGSQGQFGTLLFQNAPNATVANTLGTINWEGANGIAYPVMALQNANNFQIDPGENFTFVQIGNGLHTTNDFFLVGSGKIGWPSNDASQDLFISNTDSSNNVYFGWAGPAAGLGSSEENDFYSGVQTGKTFHWQINKSDVATLNGFGINLLSGETISSTGGTAPTLTAGCNGSGSSVAPVSTNNRGQFTTQSSAATGCTLTFNGTWPQAPICVFTDGSGSTIPTAFSAGPASPTIAIVDFASATSKVVNYVCL